MSQAPRPLLRADQIDGVELYPHLVEERGVTFVEVYDYDRSAVEALLDRPPISRASTAEILRR